MPAKGRWFVTPHAVRRYLERVRPGLTYEQALAEIIRESWRARPVKPWGRAHLWRGPKPRRLRYIVAPAPRGRRLPVLITVYGGQDR